MLPVTHFRLEIVGTTRITYLENTTNIEVTYKKYKIGFGIKRKQE